MQSVGLVGSLGFVGFIGFPSRSRLVEPLFSGMTLANGVLCCCSENKQHTTTSQHCRDNTTCRGCGDYEFIFDSFYSGGKGDWPIFRLRPDRHGRLPDDIVFELPE